APEHLAGGLVGEGQKEDARRIESGFDQSGHPVDERPGLTRTGSGDDEDRTASGDDDVALLVVQLVLVVDPIVLDPGRRAQDVLAVHAASLFPSFRSNLWGGDRV